MIAAALSTDVRILGPLRQVGARFGITIHDFGSLPRLLRFAASRQVALVLVDRRRVAVESALLRDAIAGGGMYWVIVDPVSASGTGELLRLGADAVLLSSVDVFEDQLFAIVRRLTEARDYSRTVGDIRLDRTLGRAWCAEEPLFLTAREWDILYWLLEAYPECAQIDRLAVDASASALVASVHVHICRLRRKLARSKCVSLRNVRGIGYQMVVGRCP